MSERVVAVLTAKSIDHILEDGGTQSWALTRNNARQCQFAVCVRNAHADWTEGDEAHGTAFLVGRIKDVIPSTETEGRWMIQFSDYCIVNAADAWGGWRNPVKYAQDAELGLDISKLKFEPMPVHPDAPQKSLPVMSQKPLTMAEAKAGLALTFGVSPDAIEITIRG
jgi:hypothetical protein